jgi:hypothetical protein
MSQQVLNQAQFMSVRKVGKLKSGNLRGEGTVSDWDALPHDSRYEADIAEHGVQHPLTITHDPHEGTSLTEGHHRYSAAVKAGQKDVPVTHQYKDKRGYIYDHPVRPLGIPK